MALPARMARKILAFAILLLLCLAGAATPQSGGRLNRSGYLRVTMEPLLYESNLWETNYRASLREFFAREAGEFAERLAEGLEKTAFRGRLRVLENTSAGNDANLEPDNFLITVNLRSRYGMAESGPLMACLSAASCFLLSPFDLLTYKVDSEALVDSFYIAPDGRQLRLVQSRYRNSKEVSGNFFEANDLRKEVVWIEELTDQTLRDFRGEILAELPPKLVQRSWRKVADALSRPPAEGTATPPLPPAPRQESSDTPETGEEPLPGREPEGETLDLQSLVRLASQAVFKVRTNAHTGSGFVISDRGYGVTSLAHVESAQDIRIRFHNGRELKARVILTEKALDLAVLAFRPGEAVPLALSDSNRLEPGDRLVAIGYPLEHGLSVARTPLAGVNHHRQPPLIELASDLAAGNAGGPLLNDQGEVMAILVSLPETATDTTAHALPINEARRYFLHLLD